MYAHISETNRSFPGFGSFLVQLSNLGAILGAAVVLGRENPHIQLTLPMGFADVPRLFGADALPAVGQQFLERRVRNALVPLTGEGQEERTYRQWVERRMGTGALVRIA